MRQLLPCFATSFTKVHLHKEAEFGKPWKREQRLASLPSYCLKRLPNAVRPPLSKISAVSVSCRWNICVHRKTGLGSKFEVCTRPQIGNCNYSYYLFYRSPKKTQREPHQSRFAHLNKTIITMKANATITIFNFHNKYHNPTKNI